MLWFGLDSSQRRVEAADLGREVLQRVYRVTTGGRPAMLISESFAVELRSGLYHLAG
jgi:chorismate-pyruvate lyase